MILVMILLNIMGNIAINITQHNAMQHPIYIFLLRAGGTSYSNIFRGLILKLILPIGGGKNGLVLGSFLASPTLFISAWATGYMSTLMRTLPVFSIYPLSFFVVNYTQNESSSLKSIFTYLSFKASSQYLLFTLTGLLARDASSIASFKLTRPSPIISFDLKKSRSYAYILKV